MKAKKEANEKDDAAFIVNLDPGKQAQLQEKKKQVSRPRQEVHQPATKTHPQRPLQPISNPVSMTSTTTNIDSARTTSHSKSESREMPKAQDNPSSLTSERARPLMAAPVRRAVRVVSNQRPASREEILPAESTPAARPASRNEGLLSKSYTPVSQPVSRDQQASTRHA